MTEHERSCWGVLRRTHGDAAFPEVIPLCAARVVIDPQKRLGKIGRVCVLKAHRRRCVGRRVVLRAVDALRRSHPGYTATLGSQVEAVGFYESMGFRLIPGEEPFVDGPGCLHRTMVM